MVVAPDIPPAKPPPQKPPEPDHPLLPLLAPVTGEIISIGVFVNQSDKTELRLKTGEGHEGWVLRTVRGRDVIFEKGNRDATLSLPPRNSTEPATELRIAAPVTGAPTSGTTWKDGDGQMISPPRRPPQPVAAPVATASNGGNTWMDGEGRMISPPPARTALPGITPTAVP